jgi:two-component system NtrC family sensor kinase
MKQEAGPGPKGEPANRGARVLIVDDDVDLRNGLIAMLERGGYLPADAANAVEALRLLDEREFDVAMVDVKMPELEGPDLVPLLHAKQPRLQIIMMTGEVSVEVTVRSLRAGTFDFIEKPFRAISVLGAVSRAVAARQLDRTAALYLSSRTIFDAQNFDRLPQAIVNVAMQVMAADTASLLLPSADGKLYVAHAYGLDAEVQNTTRITLGQGVAGRVAASGKPTIINGLASERAEFSDSAARHHVKSSIVYPLVSGSRLVGMLTFNRLTEERPFQQVDLEQAAVLASQVMLALENLRLARQTAISERLAAVGQLAAGVAHEINTPVQFVGDGLHFLGEALDGLMNLVGRYEALAEACRGKVDLPGLFGEIESVRDEIDLDDLRKEVPRALQRTKEGISRVTSIVRSIKAFGRPDSTAKEPTDFRKLIEATLTVTRGEYKYVADVETDIGELPLVVAHPGELSQVLLNLVVNAAHAIADKAKGAPSGERGKIAVRAHLDGGEVVLSVSDTGCGIPPELRQKIFDPFFTTKAVGRGTGLGLSIARGIVVDKHGGQLTLESEVGRGTSFVIRLPLNASSHTV